MQHNLLPFLKLQSQKSAQEEDPEKIPSQVCRSVSIFLKIECVSNAVSTGACGLPSAFIFNAIYYSTAVEDAKVTLLNGDEAPTLEVSFQYARLGIIFVNF